MRSNSGAVSILLFTICGACCSLEPAGHREPAAISDSPSNKVVVTVAWSNSHRVDTRWEVTTTVVKADGERCSSSINVPPDSSASEIAASIAHAIENVCGIEANVSPISELSRSIELTNATFGDIRLRKYGSEPVLTPGGNIVISHKSPVPIDGQLIIRTAH